MQISTYDCTGCGSCVACCPAKEKAIKMVPAKLEEKQKEITKNISALETKKSELEKQKQELENQITSLSGDVIKLKGEPRTYPAGHLTAGTDIPVGKYKIYGGSSNFVVYSKYGDLEVNIILGGSYGGVSEYIYTFRSGDKVEARSSFKLIEVE